MSAGHGVPQREMRKMANDLGTNFHNRTTDIFGKRLPTAFLVNGQLWRAGQTVFHRNDDGLVGRLEAVYSGLAIVRWDNEPSTTRMIAFKDLDTTY